MQRDQLGKMLLGDRPVVPIKYHSKFLFIWGSDATSKEHVSASVGFGAGGGVPSGVCPRGLSPITVDANLQNQMESGWERVSPRIKQQRSPL